ncbi:Nucleotide-binding universal stress protein, UspA family [Pelagirhabdus alkalitolerans]|uniref:Nucleotide-binding universal stress protein, UspA family n=1 Tax=Pelagirhabdus alkalitolerans TaxID=1612202 RepID=A0A1G6LPM1_9BACI|nr:universal stress protein [Pelagirhabdus alkalitolerans]SDC45064.1 Nucleotide-binding universal stress protein, UspA family [Pelagirhabdus alkalitolerans]
MFNNILLASDGSEYAIRACEKAIGLAEGNEEAKVTILYVVDSATSKTDAKHHWNAQDLDRSRKEKLAISERKFNQHNVKYEIKVLHGDPGPTIVEYADEIDADVCVIGSRGLNTLQEMVLGSVSHKVAKRAQCPVMIVK